MSTPPAVAIFDMDGTLTHTDTFLAFLKFVLPRRMRRFAHCARLPLAVAQYRCGFRARGWLKQEFVSAVLAHSTATEIEAWTADFVARQGKDLLKPEARAALRWHRSRGHRVIIASASLDIYTTPLARSWDVPEIVATRLEWESGILTGRLAGPNLRGEAKLAAVKELLGAGTDDRPVIYAYSDDHSDLPLLRFASHGFAVDPTPKLAGSAAREGLRTLYWNNPSKTRISDRNSLVLARPAGSSKG